MKTVTQTFQILIVDDDRDIRNMLAEWFGISQQWNALTAGDSEEALTLMRRHRFDIIISDINRPGMDGLEFVQCVRRLSGPPVIIATGYYSDRCRLQAFSGGARACIQKPFQLEAIRDIVKLVMAKNVYYIGH